MLFYRLIVLVFLNVHVAMIVYRISCIYMIQLSFPILLVRGILRFSTVFPAMVNDRYSLLRVRMKFTQIDFKYFIAS